MTSELALGTAPPFLWDVFAPEWVCAQVEDLYFLPAFVEKTTPPLAETTALPGPPLLVSVITGFWYL